MKKEKIQNFVKFLPEQIKADEDPNILESSLLKDF